MKKVVKILILSLAFILALLFLALGPVYNLKVGQEEVTLESVEEGADPVIETKDIYLGNCIIGVFKAEEVKNNLSENLFCSIFSLMGGFILGFEFSYFLFKLIKKGKENKSKNKHSNKNFSGLKEQLPSPIEQKHIKF